MSDTKEEAAPTKKGGKKKLLIGAVALLALVGGGVGAGVYAAQSGMIGGGHAGAKAENPDTPKLVPKGEEKHAAAGGEEGGHGGGPIREVQHFVAVLGQSIADNLRQEWLVLNV